MWCCERAECIAFKGPEGVWVAELSKFVPKFQLGVLLGGHGLQFRFRFGMTLRGSFRVESAGFGGVGWHA